MVVTNGERTSKKSSVVEENESVKKNTISTVDDRVEQDNIMEIDDIFGMDDAAVGDDDVRKVSTTKNCGNLKTIGIEDTNEALKIKNAANKDDAVQRDDGDVKQKGSPENGGIETTNDVAKNDQVMLVSSDEGTQGKYISSLLAGLADVASGMERQKENSKSDGKKTSNAGGNVVSGANGEEVTADLKGVGADVSEIVTHERSNNISEEILKSPNVSRKRSSMEDSEESVDLNSHSGNSKRVKYDHEVPEAFNMMFYQGATFEDLQASLDVASLGESPECKALVNRATSVFKYAMRLKNEKIAALASENELLAKKVADMEAANNTMNAQATHSTGRISDITTSHGNFQSQVSDMSTYSPQDTSVTEANNPQRSTPVEIPNIRMRWGPPQPAIVRSHVAPGFIQCQQRLPDFNSITLAPIQHFTAYSNVGTNGIVAYETVGAGFAALPQVGEPAVPPVNMVKHVNVLSNGHFRSPKVVPVSDNQASYTGTVLHNLDLTGAPASTSDSQTQSKSKRNRKEPARRRDNWTRAENQLFMELATQNAGMDEMDLRRLLASELGPRRSHEQCANHLRILRAAHKVPPAANEAKMYKTKEDKAKEEIIRKQRASKATARE